ncbi:MAG TPA: hypothetical protein DHU55_09345 [Blastocatellia bacterium]|nr:hypothetical protein [Blastocatellia bacterium]
MDKAGPGTFLIFITLTQVFEKISRFPSGQYVAKKSRKLPLADGKEWEGTGKPLKSLDGCNFRKGKYLRFCR